MFKRRSFSLRGRRVNKCDGKLLLLFCCYNGHTHNFRDPLQPTPAPALETVWQPRPRATSGQQCQVSAQVCESHKAWEESRILGRES